MTSQERVGENQELKVNLKVITAQELLSRRANMVELFNLLDDSSRRELYVGTPEERAQKLESLKKRLETTKNEVEAQKREI